jgi:hypothetical protein
VMTQRTLSRPVPLKVDACPEGHGVYIEKGAQSGWD